MKNKKCLKYLPFIIPILILIILSLLNMYGASFISPLYNKAFIRQLLWVFSSIIGFVVIYKIDIRFLYKNALFFYLLGIVFLMLVLFFGKNVNGASSWFKIGPFSIQPSEFFKFFFIIYLALVINKHKKGDIKLFFKIILVTMIPSILIFLEPDTGVAFMYILIMLGELMASKIKKRYLIILFSVGLLLVGVFLGLYIFKTDLFIKLFGTSFFYRIDRLLSFKNNTSYQLSNALIGIGSSGMFGLGITSSKIYVPEVITDFVFDLSIMNFGYLIGIFIIVIYVYLLIKIYNAILNNKKYMNRCILSGIFLMFLFQVFEHIFMNIGLTPITGITLPFLSYGGSSMLSYAMIFALILKITTNSSSYN